MKKGIASKLKNIKAVVTDVDGVLTDGGMYYSERGEEMKKFNTKDGMRLALLRERGIVVAFVSGEDTQIIVRRAEKLKVTDVYLGVHDKAACLRDIAKKYSLELGEILYIGDDVNDIPAMKICGVAVAVRDAEPEARKAAHIITSRKGGDCAVSEVARMILDAQK